jgi:hypothetical protein
MFHSRGLPVEDLVPLGTSAVERYLALEDRERPHAVAAQAAR